jgi:hypothetical protein
MYKKISLALLFGFPLLTAFTFNTTIGVAGNTVTDKYNVLNRNGTYDRPMIFDNTLNVKADFNTNVVLNGDFENGIINWNLITGSGFTTDYQSSVNHDGQYLWGKSTTGFTVQQNIDISAIKDAKYLRLYADYGGWASLDTVELKVSYLDINSVLIGTQLLSGLLTGNKDDLFNSYYKEINMPKGTTYIIIEIEEIRNSGSDSDGYIDNIVALIKPNKYYTDDIAEHLLIPDFYKSTYFYATGGNDLLEAVNQEIWSERQRYNGGKGNDYIISPVGKLNYANGNQNDDVCIAYQGSTLISSSRLNGGTGNDKLYAPISGTGHKIKGNSGFDMVVLRGNKIDYSFVYDSVNNLYKVDNGIVNISIYDDVEAISFTNENVLLTAKGNTNNSEDIWLFDTSNNILIDVFPVSLNKNIKSVNSTNYPLQITNDITGTFTMYINGLPNTIIKAIDKSGNTIGTAITEVNGLGEIKTSIRLPGVNGNTILDIILIDEQDKSVTYTSPDFSNITITRGF